MDSGADYETAHVQTMSESGQEPWQPIRPFGDSAVPEQFQRVLSFACRRAVMIELELTAARTIRFWLGDLPSDARIPGDDVVRGPTVVAEPSGEMTPRAAAVELYMPTSPRRFYALVGGSLVPHSDPAVWIDAHWSADASVAPSWALDTQRATIGLSRGDAQRIAGARISDTLAPSAGIVSVTHAVTSDVDTTPVVLLTVTRVLLEILFHPGVSESDESLRKLAMNAIREGIIVRQ
jgi:hypothetical protein